ncbi:unnamed protein product [Protopolystoma xenopodis]|uniref:Uncharacterized protein n=1 Tax=Protopolystoma xenopodis TaxID=117903 RepID=A0A448WJT0_9PLAT|nr:unnamed protein product [Protopolystoma xenopodis]
MGPLAISCIGNGSIGQMTPCSISASGSTVASTLGTIGGGGGSAFWGLHAEAAWRHGEWNEVYASLAGLANECPRSDLWRYAMIQASASVIGRRAALALSGSFLPNEGLDVLPASRTSATSSATGIGQSATAVSGLHSAGGLLSSAETEGQRVMTTLLREWRRLPFIPGDQHVPLLQELGFETIG